MPTVIQLSIAEYKRELTDADEDCNTPGAVGIMQPVLFEGRGPARQGPAKGRGMTRRPRFDRPLGKLSLIVFALAMGVSVAFSDVPSPTATQETAVSDATQPAPDENSRPSLEQLKATGPARSSYRSFRPRTVGSEPPEPGLKQFQTVVEPILRKACVQCHGPETQEGNVRIDTLDPDLLHGDDVAWWLEIRGVLSNGEMPPPDSSEMTEEELTTVTEWLSAELQLASVVRQATGDHSSFRRMTRYEYRYALQDLLGLPFDFARDLPPESISDDGFQNSSATLHMSAVQFETYRELARSALLRATVRGERPPLLYWGISMQDAAARDFAKQEDDLEKVRKKHQDDPEKLEQELKRATARATARYSTPHYRSLESGRTVRASWRYPGAQYAWPPATTRPEVPSDTTCVAVIPPGQKLIVELGDQIPEHGLLRVRIRAAHRVNQDARTPRDRSPSLQLEFGWQASNDSHASTRISRKDLPVTASEEEPAFYQWDIPLSEVYPRNSVRKVSKMGDLPSPSEFLKFVNSSDQYGDIQVDYVEVTAPVYDEWPPASHTRIFRSNLPDDDELAAARAILGKFMPRAWRRPVTPDEVEQKIELLTRVRLGCDDFQEAMVEVLATVLSSPKFLYLARPHSSDNDKTSVSQTRVTDHELATRLSIFLWCSIPDDELLQLASTGRLSHPEVLSAQVERMLKDERSQRLSEHFVRQWLDMQLLDYLAVDRKLYPAFDPALKEAMQQEPIELFREVLNHNHSVLDFIHADYAMVNERLARHYGIPDVGGNDFRKVSLQPQHQRGGLLTQAGLLAMNSDGKDSHPLKRGIWMLESLLNDPPPPPPPAVPEIDLADPEIAKLTLKERIQNHRDHAACRSCHQKIDPWGLAFENFDAIGNWRTDIAGKPVDSSSLLFNGQSLDGMEGLKRFLLEQRQDQFVRALVHKLSTYALGRPLSFADRSRIDRITADLRQQGDGLATLVKLLVTSELFQSP